LSAGVRSFDNALVVPAIFWLIVFLGAPLGLVAVYSFWHTANYAIVPGFNWANYAHAMHDVYLWTGLRTVLIALQTTAIALLVGYPVAYYLARSVKRFRLALLMLVIAPLWTSYLVRTFAWMLILGRNGLVNAALMSAGLAAAPIEWLLYSKFAVTLALVHIYLPFMVLPIYAVLENLDGRLIEAAVDLGASPWRIFLTIVLPLSMPGVVTGAIFVFVPAVGAFVTPELLGGPDANMIGNAIADQFGGTFEYPFGSALALLVIALVAVLVAVALRRGRLSFA
jgi:spermidine/putrescine transport system permease protein